MNKSISKFKVYYEDTDFNGSVYHANYLKFAERARSDMMINRGINQRELYINNKITFVIVKQEIEYKSPLFFEDIVTVETIITKFSAASIFFHQKLYVDDAVKSQINSHVVCINEKHKPCKIPNIVNQALTDKDIIIAE